MGLADADLFSSSTNGSQVRLSVKKESAGSGIGLTWLQRA